MAAVVVADSRKDYFVVFLFGSVDINRSDSRRLSESETNRGKWDKDLR